MCTHQVHHLSNRFLLKDEKYKKNRKIYGLKLKKYITYKMCLIQISFYEPMLLLYNISNWKEKNSGRTSKVICYYDRNFCRTNFENFENKKLIFMHINKQKTSSSIMTMISWFWIMQVITHVYGSPKYKYGLPRTST